MIESSKDIQTSLKEHLEAWDVVAARNDLINNQSWLKENAWELVPLIASYITQEKLEQCPQLVQTCEDLLLIVADHGNPKEVLIGLLEHCESFVENIKFKKCLPALSRALIKIPPKVRKMSWSWAFGTLVSHMTAYPDLESLHLQGKERLLYENNVEVLKRVETLEVMVNFFLEPLMKVQDNDVKNDLIVFIVQLFHRPMIFLNLHVEGEEEEEEEGERREAEERIIVKTRSRIVAETLLLHLLTLIPNPMSLIDFEEKRKAARIREGKDEESIQDDTKLSDFSFGTIYYLIFGERVSLDIFPQVYGPIHLIRTFFPFIIKFLRQKQEMVVFKGLILLNQMVHRIALESFENSFLDDDNQIALMTALINVIIYHDLKEFRSLAYENFDQYYQRFCIPARYKFCNYVIQISNHSGLIGDVIKKIKNNYLWNLENDLPYDEYKGALLIMILRRVCTLKHGVETDLLEISDEIIAALNSLYVMFVRDKANTSGIWDMKPEIITNFIQPLIKGITLSKAHHELKLRDGSGTNKCEVNLMVGGQSIPQMSLNEMQNVLHSAICTLEMMEVATLRLSKALK